MGAKVHEYRGKSIAVHYDAKRCIHAAECVHGLPGVFDPEAKPWVDPDAASADEIVAVVDKCPTGALWISNAEGEPGLQPAAENTVQIDADGPLYARGDIEVVDTDGNVLLRDTRIAFCRCGASENKPFCDGAHSKAGFSDTGAIPDPKLRQGDGSGKLKVVLANNGPLILTGPMTLTGGDDSCTGGRGALCRCGASENKPFCDGAHSRIGFSTS